MILVTGATGTTGGATLRALAAAGAPVRALTRDPSRLDAPAGVEVAVGGFEDADALRAALAGVESAYLVINETADSVELERAFVAAAREAGVRHVVHLSAIGTDESDGSVRFIVHHREVEDALRASGMQWTFLRANGFMQNYLGHAGAIAAQGVMYSAMGEGRVAHVDARDIGAVAAKALAELGHEGRAYVMSGPEALTEAQVAAAIGRGIGRDVRHVRVPAEAAHGALLELGLHPFMVDHLPELWDFFERDEGAEVSPDVERLLGRPATSFEQFARDFKVVLG